MILSDRFLLYARTASHLRPLQIYGLMRKFLPQPKTDLSPPPQPRRASGVWKSKIQKPQSFLGKWRFHFLNEEGEVNSPSDWNRASADKLWLYNLHYFDDLASRGAQSRLHLHLELIERWIAENRPGEGNGWEPYPISIRVVNWIKWALSGNNPPEGFVFSLAVQVRFLQRNLEYHLLGNHLFENARALVSAGLFFEGKEADVWLDRGLSILESEIKEQVLSDGGHFERSPMYHAIILEGILDLLNLFRLYPDTLPSKWRHIEGVCKKATILMLRWLKVMTHPDGEISLFNDAAFAIAPSLTELEEYALSIDIDRTVEIFEKVTHLSASGYIRLQIGEAVAILDVGEIGPDYLPGHAHADTLSFELSLYGSRIIVDSGTSQYGAGAERLRQRSTPAHNTVSVDGEDSSEVWAGFRVARRARPFGLSIIDGPDVVSITCSHDGFKRLKSRSVHKRQWSLDAGGLTVRDTISGGFSKAEGFFYFHPAITRSTDKQDHTLILPDGREVMCEISGGKVSVEPSTYHPGFGIVERSERLHLDFLGSDLEVSFRWN